MKNLFFPFGIWAMQSHDLTEYDVIVMSGTHCAKYVKVRPDALVISYSFTPFRLAWEPTSYAQYAQAGSVKKGIFDLVLNYLRDVDFKYGQRPNHYVAMTDETAQRLRQTYKVDKPIKIINPPVNADKFYVSDRVKDYFLVVSRLEYYKKVDLVVEAFNQLGYPLVIVGKGVQADEIKAAAGKNITFMSGLSAQELADVYAGCRAFIFPQHEDYGITPLEANAAGRPVIAYNAGGVLTTQVSVSVHNSPEKATALLFTEQTVDSLIAAVKQFERIEDQFNSVYIRQHAEQFDESLFIKRIQDFVHEKYAVFRKEIVV
ncbi:glycosyl transferase group 1 [Spirosoma montaniterrae]|uniref:Glycosyl transferase group 1 n=2 Tax=Spirosoma montaniterrae TaxID=1178516 RepID=A0A1P9X4Q0_9BACT|nr:glycosyl transferase group 1 [Spirosoma montaniterrae]